MTDYRVPHLYEGNTDTPLPGLMNLKAFLAGGNEVPDAKILVCVKSISGRKEVKLKNGGETAIYQVGIMDDTADCMLKLWGNMGDSVREWEATKTLLLISSPGEKVEFRGGVSIGLGYFSMVDVDPEFRDAVWLRNWMANRMKKEGVKQDFPEGVFDVEAAVCGVNRTLYTISEVDDWYVSSLRRHPMLIFQGARFNTLYGIPEPGPDGCPSLPPPQSQHAHGHRMVFPTT